MALDTLPALITLLIALSIATERAVEITKSLIPWLDASHTVPALEARRRAAIQTLAIVFGIAIAYLSWPLIAEVLTAPGAAPRPRGFGSVLALGLLASGGSGFWNSLLGYTVSLKTLKSAEARERRVATARVTVIPHPEEGSIAL